MTRPRFRGFHVHEAPVAAFLMAFVLLALVASLVCQIVPWR